MGWYSESSVTFISKSDSRKKFDNVDKNHNWKDIREIFFAIVTTSEQTRFHDDVTT